MTGALILHDSMFAQILEGPEASVQETFERIKRDPRHENITLLGTGPATTRYFPDWSMANPHGLMRDPEKISEYFLRAFAGDRSVVMELQDAMRETELAR